jgi:hypothetical protein
MTLSTAKVYLAWTVKLKMTVDRQVRRHTGCYKVQYADKEKSNQNPRYDSWFPEQYFNTNIKQVEYIYKFKVKAHYRNVLCSLPTVAIQIMPITICGLSTVFTSQQVQLALLIRFTCIYNTNEPNMGDKTCLIIWLHNDTVSLTLIIYHTL